MVSDRGGYEGEVGLVIFLNTELTEFFRMDRIFLGLMAWVVCLGYDFF